MDSDILLDHALFQLSPRRSRCELFVSGGGKTEKIASGFLKPFLAHLKVSEEQSAEAVDSIKLIVDRRTKDGTWFKKGTVERFVRFVGEPEVLEFVNTFDAEMSQLEGAKKIYLQPHNLPIQNSGVPVSGSMGENGTTTEASVDITKNELLRAIEVRLVAVKQDLTKACCWASSNGFTPKNVLELLHFADYFGADHLNEACTKFISLCQKHPDLFSLQHLPWSLPLPLKSLGISSSSGSDVLLDEPEDEPKVGGKPPDGGGLHLHKHNNSQPAQINTAELLCPYPQLKPIQQHFVDRTVGNVVDSIPAASFTKPAQRDEGGSRRLSVQDRISLFESKQKEQSVSSRNISTIVGIKRVVAGKGEPRRIPSDVSEKSVLRRWSAASDMSIDLSSSSCSSFNDEKDGGSASGTPTSANLQFQSSNRIQEGVTSGLTDTMTVQSQLSPKACIAITPCQFHPHFQTLSKDRDHAKEEVDKTLMTPSEPAFPKEQIKHIIPACQSGKILCQLNNQDVFGTQQDGFLESGNCAGLKCHAVRHPQFETTSVDYVQANNHVILQATSQSVLAAEEKAGLRDQESSRTRTGKISSHPDGVRVKYQPTLSTQLQIFAKKPDDAQVGTQDPSDFQINSRAISGIYLESHPQWAPLSKPVGADSSGTVVSEQPFGPILVKEKGDLGHLGINFKDQSSSSDCPNKFQSETTHSERYSLPVFPVRDAKECMELLDPPSTCSAEQIQMVSSLEGGNQKLNNELQMKANELENLFAEHKLRIQKDQATTFQRSSDAHKDHVKALEKGHAIPVQLPERKFVKETSKKEVEFDANLLSNMVNNRKFDNNICQGFDNKSDDFRGKFYDKYMQKRNAKLLEEWKSKRPQKEAKMKALRDNLEHTLAEMRAKFIGSANGQYLRSFSCSSVL
ncbi:uncharacterized protein LOC103991403 isoform X1 [Musa acuminata AAA Group]|uniref:uncharacterized protein LOC103991403 isoform X1 n=1 Tax=Musa acuminata AAA Group TaxID=214697 RepID=UPI0031D6B0CD